MIRSIFYLFLGYAPHYPYGIVRYFYFQKIGTNFAFLLSDTYTVTNRKSGFDPIWREVKKHGVHHQPKGHNTKSIRLFL